MQLKYNTSTSSAPAIAARCAIYSAWFLPCALFLLTLFVMGHVLLDGGSTVLSQQTNDGDGQIIEFRTFGFDQLRHGHLALWNSHLFSGEPFMGNWQSALLYPPNWIYMVLPIGWAMNSEFMLSIFLSGLGMALWTRHHGMHPLASLLAGTMTMFGGPFFLHLWAGHASMLDAMAWAPYILLAIDGILGVAEESKETLGQVVAGNLFERYIGWCLLLTAAVVLQIVAGHPQIVYNTAVTAVFYVALRLVWNIQLWRRVIFVAVAGGVGILVGLPQIVAGIAAAKEGVRSSGMSYNGAKSFSLPPINLFTTFAPTFFGNLHSVPYWGQEYNLWEVSLFTGIAGLSLALYALIRRKSRFSGLWAAMILITLCLALGGYTPLFPLLYQFMPGLKNFRCPGRFTYDVGLFIALAASAGLTALIRGDFSRRFGVVVGSVGIFLCLCGGAVTLVVQAFSKGIELQDLLVALGAPFGDLYSASQSSTSGAILTGSSLAVAGLTALSVGILIFTGRKRPRLIYGVVLVGMLECCLFAWQFTGTFRVDEAHSPACLRQASSVNPGDYRVEDDEIWAGYPDNIVMMDGLSDIWGYDPCMIQRYADYFNDRTSSGNAQSSNKLMGLFRLRYIAPYAANQVTQIPSRFTMPHVFLVKHYIVQSGIDNVVSTLTDKKFDLRQTAVVETAPVSDVTDGPAQGSVSIHEDYPGCLTLQSDTASPSIAVVTDAYSSDWRASSLDGNREQYGVFPVDYAAIGLILPAGKHTVRLVYMPAGFEAAVKISIAMLFVYFLMVGVYLKVLFSKRLQKEN